MFDDAFLMLIYQLEGGTMEDIKKNRRSIKEITEDMLKINSRKPSKEELINLVNVINENAIIDDEEESDKN